MSATRTSVDALQPAMQCDAVTLTAGCEDIANAMRGSGLLEGAVAMDLGTVALQMKLDRIAVQVSRALAADGIPHALIKGVTTARWLYDPPRRYNDVDVLVPASTVNDAARCLVAAGVARIARDRLGHAAGHSWVLLTPDKFEVDLHVTLPGLNTPVGRRRDRVWDALSRQLSWMDLDGTQVPVLSIPGRYVVLAMHLAASGPHNERVRIDFDMARRRVTTADKSTARMIAIEAGIHRHLRAIEIFMDSGHITTKAPLSVRQSLKGISGPRLRAAQLLSGSVRELLWGLASETAARSKSLSSRRR